MMKSWHDDIRKHIEHWSAQLGKRGWWPRYVYHFTDVQNAASILCTGELLSRSEAQKSGVMQVDNASPEVLERTSPEHFSYARLYFRPRTPTQYNNEGIRPKGQRRLGGAHCPVPVYFCFDAFSVLAMDETAFSDGNIGSSRARIGKDQDFFKSIPFQLVFHNTAFPAEERDEIVFRRNAEILVPNRLSLEPALQSVFCRSPAERQMLLHLLPAQQKLKWAKRILVDFDYALYERKWTYVERFVVESMVPRIHFHFNPSSTTPGPFHVRFTYQEHWSGKTYEFKREFDRLDRHLSITLPKADSGEVTLWLDDALAFQGEVRFGDVPF